MYHERVQIYRNLHRQCWSVRSAKTGLVLGHEESITLTGSIKFHVQPAGRRKVILYGRKNVHAFIAGDNSFPETHFPGEEQATYNPYMMDAFRLRPNPALPVNRASNWALAFAMAVTFNAFGKIHVLGAP